jgi:hypothetical protein
MTTWAFDQPVTLTVHTYSDAALAVPADPTALTVDVLGPDDTETSHVWPSGDVTRAATGVFTLTLTPTLAGRYAFHWKATGAVASGGDGSFFVEAKYGTQSLDVLTLDEAKAAIVNNAGTVNDDLLGAYVTGVSRYLDELCGPIVKRTITDEEAVVSGQTVILSHSPVLSITTLTEYTGTTAQVLAAENFPSSTTGNDYKLLHGGRSGLVERRASGVAATFASNVRVIATYVAGRYNDTVSVDERFKRAAGIILANFWRREHGLAGVDPSMMGATFGLPNAAEALLAGDIQVRVG